MIHNLPQPEFEAFVAEELRKGGRAEVRKGWGFVESTEDSAGQRVVTVIEERGSKRRVEVRSQYVVGCDGAKSAVRQSLGIECDGEDSYEAMMTIHFRADLRPVLGPNVGMLHWMLDPAVSGFIIGYDLGGNEVLISNFDVSVPVSVLRGSILTGSTAEEAPGRSVDRGRLSTSPRDCRGQGHAAQGGKLAALDSEP